MFLLHHDLIEITRALTPKWYESPLFCAVIGGLIAAIPAAFLVYKEIPRLDIQLAKNPSPQNPHVPEVKIHVINKGYRSLMIRRLFMRQQDSSEVDFEDIQGMNKPIQPFVIEGLSSKTFVMTLGSIFTKNNVRKNQYFPDIFCEDATGAQHKVSLTEKFWFNLID